MFLCIFYVFYEFLWVFNIFCLLRVYADAPFRDQWGLFHHWRMLFSQLFSELLVLLQHQDILHSCQSCYMGDISANKCENCVQNRHRFHTSFASFRGVLASRYAYCVHIRHKVSIDVRWYPSSGVPRGKCVSCDPCPHIWNRCFPQTSVLHRILSVPSRCSGKKIYLQVAQKPSQTCWGVGEVRLGPSSHGSRREEPREFSVKACRYACCVRFDHRQSRFSW